MSTIDAARPQSEALTVTRLDGAFGVRFHGLDLASDMGDATMQALSDLLFAHKVVVVSGQQLDNATYVRFGHKWGTPIDFFKDDHRGVVHRELIRVSNATTVPMEHRDGAVQWHNDSSYEEVPSSITMLQCLEAPDEGGETLFADVIAACEALDPATRARIDGLSAWHTILGGPALEGEMIEKMAAPDWGKYLHPLIYDHPVVAGRKALYTSATAQSIDGMDYDEGRELIRALRKHSFSEPFQNSYKLQKGDLILWDNFSVAHSATPLEYSDEPGKFRLLQRTAPRAAPITCRGRSNSRRQFSGASAPSRHGSVHHGSSRMP